MVTLSQRRLVLARAVSQNLASLILLTKRASETDSEFFNPIFETLSVAYADITHSGLSTAADAGLVDLNVILTELE